MLQHSRRRSLFPHGLNWDGWKSGRTGKGAAAPPPEILRDGMNGRDCKLWICLCFDLGWAWLSFVRALVGSRWFPFGPFGPVQRQSKVFQRAQRRTLDSLPWLVVSLTIRVCPTGPGYAFNRCFIIIFIKFWLQVVRGLYL